MNIPTYSLRPWTPDDHPEIVRWRVVHGVEAIPANLVPPLAAVIERDGEPVAFGVCFQTATRPGLSLGQARTAIRHVIECLKDMLASTGPTILLTYCGPALSSEAIKLGFLHDKQPLRMHFMLLEHKPVETK